VSQLTPKEGNHGRDLVDLGDQAGVELGGVEKAHVNLEAIIHRHISSQAVEAQIKVNTLILDGRLFEPVQKQAQLFVDQRLEARDLGLGKCGHEQITMGFGFAPVALV
jgi:hypothetical protein